MISESKEVTDRSLLESVLPLTVPGPGFVSTSPHRSNNDNDHNVILV